MKLTVKLKQLRQSKGWTQEQTATITGISIDHIKSIEYGRKSPSLKMIETIAETFGCKEVNEILQAS